MIHLFLSLFLLMVVIVCHIFWCRSRSYEGMQVSSLLGLFLGGLFSYGIVCIFFRGLLLDIQRTLGLWDFSLEISAGLVYMLLTSLYFFLYCTTAIDSPSGQAFRTIREKGAMSFEDLVESLGGNYFVISRLDALVQDGFVDIRGDRYFLTWRGRLLGWAHKFYRGILGRSAGG